MQQLKYAIRNKSIPEMLKGTVQELFTIMLTLATCTWQYVQG